MVNHGLSPKPRNTYKYAEFRRFRVPKLEKPQWSLGKPVFSMTFCQVMPSRKVCWSMEVECLGAWSQIDSGWSFHCYLSDNGHWSLASTNLNRISWLIPLADHRITRTSDPLGKGISPIITGIRGTVAMIIRQVLRWRSGWVVPADATWPTKRWTVAVSLCGPFLSCNGVEIETEICNPGAIVAAKTQEYELQGLRPSSASRIHRLVIGHCQTGSMSEENA